MPVDRRQRLVRLLELRAKELDERVGELRAAQESERVAIEELARARSQALTARQARDALAKKGTSIDDWTDTERWVARQTERERWAEKNLAARSRGVGDARDRVKKARIEREKLERLAAHLAEKERRSNVRADQKVNDDSAAVRFLRQREDSRRS